MQLNDATVDGTVIHCEGRDDLEVVTPTQSRLVSVKARNADVALLRREFMKLKRVGYGSQRLVKVAVVLVGPQEQEVSTFIDHLEKAGEMLRHREGEEGLAVLEAFGRRWKGWPTDTVNNFFVMVLPRGLHSQEFVAVVAQQLRRVAPVTDYTDDRINQLINLLGNRFAAARLSRGSVTLREVRDEILRAVMPLETIAFAHAYVRTRYGYVKHPEVGRILQEDRLQVDRAAKAAMRRYRRATRGARISMILMPPIACLACNGPLLANLAGSTRRGFACSHCGFNPYLTIFYACACGTPVPLVTQPPVDLIEMSAAIAAAIGQTRCAQCGAVAKPERWMSRIFQLNIPWPPDGFSSRNLIAAREAFGWHGHRFRDGSVRPLDVLTSEALLDSVERRLRSDGSG